MLSLKDKIAVLVNETGCTPESATEILNSVDNDLFEALKATRSNKKFNDCKKCLDTLSLAQLDELQTCITLELRMRNRGSL